MKKAIINKIDDIRFKMGWMKIFFSPFKSPTPFVHIGKIKVGVPYMLPRVWRTSKEDDKHMTATPRKFGFDIVSLGWKWKFDSVRHEWNPVWSFVIWKLQIAIIWHLECREWESYLEYEYNTNKEYTKLVRLLDSRRQNPNVWLTCKGEVRSREDYFIKSLKKRWKKRFTK